MAILNAISKRFHKSAPEPSIPEPIQTNKESELARLAKILERALPEKDRQLLGNLVRGATREHLCLWLKVTIDELKPQVARVRWKFKEVVERHDFHRSENPEVRRFLRRTYSVLSQ